MTAGRRRLPRVAGRALAAAALLALLVAPAALEARPWAWLGIRIRDLSEPEMEELSARHGIREGFGVLVVEVLEGTPAARAGLRPGDIVVALGDRPVTETRVLQRLVAAAPTDRDTRVTVLRANGRRELAVRLVPMPRDVMGDRVAAEFGFALRDDAVGEGAEPRLAGQGPVVGTVLRGSAAERAGLQAGDVLLQVDARAVLSREAAREALAEIPLDRPLVLVVRRGAERLTLRLPAPEPAR